MPEAIKLFSKGFGSIWSSVCEKKHPTTNGRGISHSPELAWLTSWLNVSMCCSQGSDIVTRRLNIRQLQRADPSSGGLPKTFMTMSLCEEPRMRKSRFALNFAEKQVQRHLS